MQKKLVKFEIGDLLGIAMTMVVLGIGVAYGLDIMEDIRGDMTSGGLAANATTSAMEGVAKIPEKLPTIATVVVAAVLIGILVRYLWSRFA